MSLTRITNVQIATLNKETFTFTPSSSSLSLQLTYSKPTASSSAYLDWIELEVPCTLSMHSDQVDFRDPASVGEGNITRFVIQGAAGNTRVWDITDPSQAFQLALSSESNGQSFKSGNQHPASVCSVQWQSILKHLTKGACQQPGFACHQQCGDGHCRTSAFSF